MFICLIIVTNFDCDSLKLNLYYYCYISYHALVASGVLFRNPVYEDTDLNFQEDGDDHMYNR